jgi:hypothetical protein
MGTAGGALMPLILDSFFGRAIAPDSGRRRPDQLVIAVVTPLGDLGQSMFKRQSGSRIRARSAGPRRIFDRIDLWIWAG